MFISLKVTVSAFIWLFAFSANARSLPNLSNPQLSTILKCALPAEDAVGFGEETGDLVSKYVLILRQKDPGGNVLVDVSPEIFVYGEGENGRMVTTPKILKDVLLNTQAEFLSVSYQPDSEFSAYYGFLIFGKDNDYWIQFHRPMPGGDPLPAVRIDCSQRAPVVEGVAFEPGQYKGPMALGILRELYFAGRIQSIRASQLADYKPEVEARILEFVKIHYPKCEKIDWEVLEKIFDHSSRVAGYKGTVKCLIYKNEPGKPPHMQGGPALVVTLHNLFFSPQNHDILEISLGEAMFKDDLMIF